MAHFAEIDENNKVIRVLVVDNEFENEGEDYLANQLGLGGRWIQTSYNAKFRGKFAGIGDVYDVKKDMFISPEIDPEILERNEKRQELLERLGITEEEAKLLLG